MNDPAYLLIEARYCLRQLRDYRDIGRAIDALERVEAHLADAVEFSENHVLEEDGNGIENQL